MSPVHSAIPHRELATLLHEARLTAKEQVRLTEAHPSLGVEDAYRIQELGIELRQAAGERIVGYKMGLTSQAKRTQMGLHESIFGVITDRMQLKPGEPYRLAGQIHPKAEPEIAVHLASDLSGLVSRDEAWEAVDSVAPAIEVLDSRFKGFKYFSLPDVIADNASSSQFLIGASRPKPADWRELESWKLTFRSLDPGHEPATQEALGSEISGSPIQSLVEQAALLAARGKHLPAGSWVLLGAATPAVALKPGTEISLELGGSITQLAVALDT